MCAVEIETVDSRVVVEFENPRSAMCCDLTDEQMRHRHNVVMMHEPIQPAIRTRASAAAARMRQLSEMH